MSFDVTVVGASFPLCVNPICALGSPYKKILLVSFKFNCLIPLFITTVIVSLNPVLSSSTCIIVSPTFVPGTIVIIPLLSLPVAISESSLVILIFPVYKLFLTVIIMFSPSICDIPEFELSSKKASPHTALNVVSEFIFIFPPLKYSTSFSVFPGFTAVDHPKNK